MKVQLPKLFKLIFLWVLPVIIAAPKQACGQTFVHPGIPFTNYDLAQLKANIAVEPWKTAYTAFAADAKSQLTYGMQGPFAIVGRAPDINNTPFKNDMQAVFNLTFMYVFTSNTAYAQKATDILNAWAVTNTKWTGDETFLDLGDYAERYVTAADILKSTYPGWTAANTTNVNNYFNNVLWPQVDVPNPVRGANQGAIQLKAALAIAVFLDDATKWNQAIADLRKDAAGGLSNSLSNGEVGDSGRDEGHWAGQLQALAWNAEVAWKQGIDLFGELDNRLLTASELYSQYQAETTDIPYIKFGGAYAFWGGGFGGPRGARRKMNFYNIIRGAYTLRKGLPAPYTLKLDSLIGEGVESFLFLKTADNSTATIPAPITHPTFAGVAGLADIDVGNVGLAGSAGNSNGTWTIKGAGADIPVPPLTAPDAFHFAFKQITGDAAIITRVTAIDNTSPDAKAGVMFRESLAENAKYVGLFIKKSGEADASWRGATAWNKTNVSWNNPPAGYQSHGIAGAPYWLKLERLGTRIYAYHAEDGINWTCISTVETPISATAYVGLCVTSHNASALNSSTFTDVGITNTIPAGAPVITSANADTATVNSPYSFTILTSPSSTSFQADGLPPGLSVNPTTGVISGSPTTPGKYVITVKAANANGTGSDLLIITVRNNVAPAAPASLALIKQNDNSVSLSWVASPNTTSYTVKRSLTSGGPYSVIVSNVVSTAYTDANPYPGPNYYVVTASAGALESSNSNEAGILLPPSLVTSLSAANLDSKVSLSWHTATGAATYTIKRAAISGGPYTVIASGVTDTTYTDQNLSNGGYYYYVVASKGSSLESGNSAEVLGVPGASSNTWSATAADANWTNPANWESTTAPVSPALLTFNNSSVTALNNDINGLEIPRLIFNSNAAAYTFAGNGVTVGNDIYNYSANGQVINLPVVITRPVSVITNAGALTLGGVISGSGGIVKSGSGTVVLKALNTYSGNTIVNGGGSGGWPPNFALQLGGTGTGTIGAPLSGAAGTGKIILNGGALMNNGFGTIFNDVIVKDSVKSYMYIDGGGLALAGRLLGKGTLEHDGNNTQGLQLNGDNTGFEGTFISINRSSNSRIRFNTPTSGSAKASWVLNSGFTDAHGFTFTGVLQFGALSGNGQMRRDNGSPVISIGALNKNTTFGGIISGAIAIIKEGTGTLRFTGTNNYTGGTTVNAGAFLIDSVGQVTSPVLVNAGTIGGIGTCAAALTVGSGSGAGSFLSPGSNAIGTMTVTGLLTMNVDATLKAEIKVAKDSADQVKAGSVTLNAPLLSIQSLSADSVPRGAIFTIINNTGTAAVSGTFKNLPELSMVNINGTNFRISYKGGTGNDVILRDNRTTPPLLTSADSAKAIVGSAFSYQVTAINSPKSFNATGLPPGLAINTATGNISGTPVQVGTFPVSVSASNDTLTATAIITFVIKSNVVDGLNVASGDKKTILEWDALNGAAYNVKRSASQAGPFTVLANVATNRFADTTVVNGTTYYYVVSAVINNADNPNSAVAVATPNIGQVHYYRFNEAGGTQILDSWSAVHGSMATAAVRQAGYIDQSLYLNGTSTAYATLPAGFVSTLNNFTIAAWVKMDALSNWMRVFDFGSSTTNYMFLTVQTGVTGGKSIVGYGIKNGTPAELNLRYNYTFPLNTWTHLAITQSGNTLNMFINGALVATSTTITIKPADLGNTTQNYLGKSQFNDPMFKGAIDDFRIYGRALSTTEIAGLTGKDQAITFAAMPAKFVGDADFDPAATASSGLPVSYASSDTSVVSVVNGKLHIIKADTVSITASQAGFDLFRPAVPVSQTLIVSKKTQQITFNPIGVKRLGDADFTVTASSTSSLPVTFISSSPGVAAVNNGLVHLVGPGTVTITAMQQGNFQYDSAAVSQQFRILPVQLKVLYKDGDNGQLTNNTIKPYLMIASTDSIGVVYSELTARYWITAENYAGINFYVDYAQMGNSKIKGRYVPLTQPRNNAFGYIEYSFDNGTAMLAPQTNTGEIQTRVANSDWSLFDESNDYSYQPGTAYAENSKFTLYRNNVLIWGTEPSLIQPSTAVTAFTQSIAAGSSTISTYLRIDNTGNTALSYKDIKVRYFFTKDSNAGLNYFIDYAKLGTTKISGQFYGLSPSYSTADSELELKIDSTAGQLYPLTSSGNIQYRIAKADWSALNQANDYSYQTGAMSANNHVCVYYKGSLIYGTEPGSYQPTSFALSLGGNNAMEFQKPVTENPGFVTYPNPVVNGHFTVRTTPIIPDGDVQLTITDFYGKVVYRKSATKSGNLLPVQLNTNIPSGNYILQLNNQYAVKIIIN
jgi:autotransporter-associated beta strand protein